jgi:hypothetical protein
MTARGGFTALVVRFGIRSRQAIAFVALVSGAASVAACSLLLDWGDYTGKGGNDAAVAAPCGTNGQCAALPPPSSSWEGPVAFYPPASTPPGCGTGFDSFYKPSSAPAGCASCSCGNATGAVCAQPQVTFYSDSTCQTQCDQKTLTSMTCVTPSSCGTYFAIGTSIAQGGTCPPSGGEPTVPAPMELAGTACPPATPVSSTCSEGQLCLATPPNPAAPRICVRTNGFATSCPGGDSPYTFGPEIYYTDPSQVMDTRGCTSCTCDAPTGTSCTFPPLGTLSNIRYDSMCMFPSFAPPMTFNVPSTCQPLANQGFELNTPFKLDAGTCGPAGGQPTGTVVPTGQPTSLCCRSMGP